MSYSSSAEPNAWADLETGLLRPDQEFYDRWAKDLSSAVAWETFHRVRELPVTKPPPQPDAETLLQRMIVPEEGGKLIPEMFTALKILKRNGIITCGLTNNFVYRTPSLRRLRMQIIDDDSPYLPLAQLTSELIPHFDYFLQSAELGIRKPNPAIFQYALQTIGCAPQECVFLDDIGSNLKAAQMLGIRCIRVRIGKEAQAVRELEAILGMNLRNDKARL